MNTHEDDQMVALVGADRSSPAAPDLDTLKSVGRRRLLRRRIAIGSAVVASVTVLAVPLVAINQGDDDARQQIATDPTPTAVPPTPSPTPTPSESPTLPQFPAQGEVKTSLGNYQGVWEDGEVVGSTMELGTIDDHDEILYAAHREWREGKKTVESTYVATGLRDGDRTLQFAWVLEPAAVKEADGIDLYGGNVVDLPSMGEMNTFRIYGAAPGDVDITVTEGADDAPPRMQVETSTTVLPGFTVFVISGPWQDGWDRIKFPPLTVQTSDGKSVKVRERTWTG